MEANSSYLWDTELRPGNAGTWDGSIELMATCFVSVPRGIRELRVRADAGFGFNPVLEIIEARATQYAVVARLTQAFKRLLPGRDSLRADKNTAGIVHRLPRVPSKEPGTSPRAGASNRKSGPNAK